MSQSKKRKRTASAKVAGGRPTSASVFDQLQAAVAADPANFDAALALAEYCNNHGSADRILELLLPFEKDYRFQDKSIRGNYNRLLGFGYAHSGRFLDAERVLERGLSEYPDSLDFLYALCFVKMSLREYSLAIEIGEKYLEVLQRLTCDPSTDQLFNGMAGHASQLYNYLGSAWLEQHQIEKARRYFQEAIVANETNHLPYLNLASLHIREKNWDSAKEIIYRGLKHCEQVHELRILAESLKKKATVSACLMVKNEEELLPGCLESIRDWVDEIIVVDTGSTDRTVEIAHSFGATVYSHPWEGSFSQSRNHTLQYASKDWVFIVDADERVFTEDVQQIIKAINLDNADVITVNVYNVYPDHEDTIVFLPSHRFIRRELQPRYEGIVHNQLVLPENARIVRTSVRIKHLGYGLTADKMKQKALRTRALLEKQLAEDPDNAFALFNYAQLLRSGPEGFQAENAQVIIDAATRAINLTGPADKATRHIYLMCLDQLAWTHYYLGDYDGALDFSSKALAAKSDYLDPLLLHGYIHFAKNDLKQATHYFEKYLSAQAAYDPSKELENIILIHLNGRVDALFNLGAIAELSGDLATARDRYRAALKINERYTGANLNLGRLYLQENNLAEAEQCYRRLVETNKATPPALLGLAHIYREWGDFARSEQMLKQALQTDPTSIQALSELSDLHLASGRYDDAITTLQAAFDAKPSDRQVGSRLADTLARVGQFDAAIAVYLRLEKQSGLSPELSNDLANCYYRVKKFPQAETYYARALEADPHLAAAQRNLGLTKAQLNKTAEAIALLEAYLEHAAGQYDLEHIVGDLKATVGDFSGALTHYENYLQHRPTDPTALFRLSECYLHMGHRDSAILGYRRALAVDPLFRPAQERLAELVPVGQVQ